MPPRMVLSHIDAVSCNNILHFCSTFQPKGASKGSSLEVSVECFDSPWLHRSLLIKDIFKIGTCSLLLLATAAKPFLEPTQPSLKLWTTTSSTDHPANTSNWSCEWMWKAVREEPHFAGENQTNLTACAILWGVRWVVNLKTMDKWPDLSNMKLEEAYEETQPKRESRSDGDQAKAVHFCHVAFSDYAVNI